MEPTVSGYILCGGRNRRMGGQKKLFLQAEGLPFYQHILQALSPLPLVRLSVEAAEPYRHLGLELVVDEIGGIGPIGGLYSGLRGAREDALLVVACDMPLLDAPSVQALLDAYHSHPVPTVSRTGDRVRPFPGIYPRRCLPHVEEMIRAGNYRMRDLLSRLTDLRTVPLSDQAGQNINTPEEYHRLTQALSAADGRKL